MAFILNKTGHTVGDRRCVECWKGFPVRCMCGGQVHAQFIRENWQNVTELAYGCDTCGEKFILPGQKPKRKYQPKRRRCNNKPK